MIDSEMVPDEAAPYDYDMATGQTLLNSIENQSCPPGCYYCVNIDCEITFFEVSPECKETKRTIRCHACQSIICKKCNSHAHGMARCKYECPKCSKSNPIENLVSSRAMKWH